MIKETGTPPEMIIAPDSRYDGTNCMIISPPGQIDYAFGPGSFKKHMEQAQKYGYRTVVIVRQSLQLDLDVPEDLDTLESISNKNIAK
jgi:2-phospho-L-lactate guanylyltransferase